MSRSMLGLAAGVLCVAGFAASQAAAADLERCRPHHRPVHHRDVVQYGPRIVYGAHFARRVPNYEDNGRYDGADVPPPVEARVAYGQGPSWLDGYGTRTVEVPGYGPTDIYGGSAQRWPRAIPPAGGLAVYIPGAYGPGPRIIEIPPAY